MREQCCNYQDMELKLSENGHIQVNVWNRKWNTRQDFHAYIELTDHTILYFEQADRMEMKNKRYAFGEILINQYFYETYDFDICIGIEFNYVTNDVEASLWSHSDFQNNLKRILWPGPFEFSREDPSGYTVMPIMQGALIPNGWKQHINLEDRWEFEAEYVYSRSAYMPWFGQTNGTYGYMGLVKTPLDAGFSFVHDAGRDTQAGVIWYSELGRAAYKRVICYKFFETCDYNRLCKEYRTYLRETGLLCTLKEKIVKNAKVSELIGAAIYHDEIYHKIHPDSFFYDKLEPGKLEELTTFEEMCERIRKVKELGIPKMVIHMDGWGNVGYDSRHPDVLPPCEKAGSWEGLKKLVHEVHKMNYLFTIHDQYRDFYLDAPSYSRELSKLNADGTADRCHYWNGGQQEFLCPEFYLRFVKRNFTELFKHGVRIDGAYLDVFACIALEECYNKDHMISRRQCMEKRKECFRYVRSQGGIISSEEGIGWAMEDLDLIHHAPYGQENQKDDSQLCGEILPQSFGIPVPLLNLVYHDCVVTPWFVGDGDSEMPNYESGFLHALLNGGVSYVKYNYTDTEIARVKTVSQLHGKVALSEMLSHEFIGGDLKRQRTVFSDGTVVEVDFRQNTYHIISEKKE